MQPSPASADLTRLLHDWRDGDEAAREELWPLVYGQLKKLAHHILSERRGEGSLQTTVLVHELYLRLSGGESLSWNDRGHFYAIAARAMRYILVDQLRRQRAAKRGGREQLVPLDQALELPVRVDVDLVALDDALRDFETLDPRRCRVVELTYFAGLSYEEIGQCLEISPATVKRDLRTAKLWLLRELGRGETPQSPSLP